MSRQSYLADDSWWPPSPSDGLWPWSTSWLDRDFLVPSHQSRLWNILHIPLQRDGFSLSPPLLGKLYLYPVEGLVWWNISGWSWHLLPRSLSSCSSFGAEFSQRDIVVVGRCPHRSVSRNWGDRSLVGPSFLRPELSSYPPTLLEGLVQASCGRPDGVFQNPASSCCM